MPGYSTREMTVRIGGRDFRIRALSDRQQYADPSGLARRAGISSATWSLFGQLWPAGRVLAEAMSDIPITGRRILEVGCGLGLSSLVLRQREADILATDHHPLAEEFLVFNARINGLEPVPYRDLPWDRPAADMGRFDLIIGADLLYERDHPTLLARLVRNHARHQAEVVLTDPGRGSGAPFARLLEQQGFSLSLVTSRFDERDTPPFRGRLMRFVR